MRKSPKFSPEVMERAVRMVFDAKDQYPSQWAAIESIAGKIGCTAETLRRWVRRGERDVGADFSDRGRLFQADRGRRIGVVGDALGKRASSRLECSSIVHDQPETRCRGTRDGVGVGVRFDLQISRPLPGRRRRPDRACTHARSS